MKVNSACLSCLVGVILNSSAAGLEDSNKDTKINHYNNVNETVEDGELEGKLWVVLHLHWMQYWFRDHLSEPDVILLQVSGAIDTDLTKVTASELMMWGLENLWKENGKEGGYAVRHGQRPVNDFEQLQKGDKHRNHQWWLFKLLEEGLSMLIPIWMWWSWSRQAWRSQFWRPYVSSMHYNTMTAIFANTKPFPLLHLAFCNVNSPLEFRCGGKTLKLKLMLCPPSPSRNLNRLAFSVAMAWLAISQLLKSWLTGLLAWLPKA